VEALDPGEEGDALEVLEDRERDVRTLTEDLDDMRSALDLLLVVIFVTNKKIFRAALRATSLLG
jgi:hypothetical protein